ncbi:hypothetical protein D9757_008188 [Collybiopsis confluens]|uniref:Protein kinase domain-containing protein n=1 Tax=Collybiopsis confluens TaxID=2823264 RepID=A0A8H5HBX8_9AGAR|nr:hypothetical protein D9757_008188 [Collybiopsis confluens]
MESRTLDDFTRERKLITSTRFWSMHQVAHLDIKPDNLVYHPDTFQLQIINFDVAVLLANHDQKISGCRGTEGWMAPEVKSGKPFNPFLADRYSCGLVIEKVVLTASNADRVNGRAQIYHASQLHSFAVRLTAEKPGRRPPLKLARNLGLGT